MRNLMGMSNKYCYECRRLILMESKTCPYCKTDLRLFKKQSKVRCKYCGKRLPAEAKFCKYCGSKNPRLKKMEEDKMLEQLKVAADIYAKNKKEKQHNNELAFTRCHVECLYGYGNFKQAKNLFLKTGGDCFKIQTMEFGEDTISYDDFISCHRMNGANINEYFKIPLTDGLLGKVILISTLQGNIVLLDNSDTEKFISSIYYHLIDNVVEFENCFYNADYVDTLIDLSQTK